MNKNQTSVYDCGCVPSRPQDSSCKNYGTRWRAFRTPYKVILRCRDCGKSHVFEVTEPKMDIQYFGWSR